MVSVCCGPGEGEPVISPSAAWRIDFVSSKRNDDDCDAHICICIRPEHSKAQQSDPRQSNSKEGTARPMQCAGVLVMASWTDMQTSGRGDVHSNTTGGSRATNRRRGATATGDAARAHARNPRTEAGQMPGKDRGGSSQGRFRCPPRRGPRVASRDADPELTYRCADGQGLEGGLYYIMS